MVERMSDALAFLTEQVAARAHLCVAKKSRVHCSGDIHFDFMKAS